MSMTSDIESFSYSILILDTNTPKTSTALLKPQQHCQDL